MEYLYATFHVLLNGNWVVSSTSVQASAAPECSGRALPAVTPAHPANGQQSSTQVSVGPGYSGRAPPTSEDPDATRTSGRVRSQEWTGRVRSRIWLGRGRLDEYDVKEFLCVDYEDVRTSGTLSPGTRKKRTATKTSTRPRDDALLDKSEDQRRDKMAAKQGQTEMVTPWVVH